MPTVNILAQALTFCTLLVTIVSNLCCRSRCLLSIIMLS